MYFLCLTQKIGRMKITARMEKSMPALVSCYDQFLVMCLAQYAAKNSLRDIEASLIVVEHRLYQSGISYARKFDTLKSKKS